MHKQKQHEFHTWTNTNTIGENTIQTVRSGAYMTRQRHIRTRSSRWQGRRAVPDVCSIWQERGSIAVRYIEGKGADGLGLKHEKADGIELQHEMRNAGSILDVKEKCEAICIHLRLYGCITAKNKPDKYQWEKLVKL